MVKSSIFYGHRPWTTTDATDLGSRLSSISIADEISQVELARKMKISRAHLCDIERGRRTISIERATEFAKILGYSINQFVAVALEEQAREAGLNVKIYLKAA